LRSRSGDIVTDSIATLVLDGSALLALAAGHPRARAYVTWAVRSRTRVVAPATAFLDPAVAAVAASVADVVPIYASTAEVAATLLSHARLSLPIDALHVALASKLRPAAILTRDRRGLGALVNARRSKRSRRLYPLSDAFAPDRPHERDQKKFATSELPPYEKNGSVMPVSGKRPSTPPTMMKT
jgi:predicted nucleic acid-binding protein